MPDHQHMPDTNRLSIVAAAILLAYSLTPFVNVQKTELTLRLPFIILNYTLDINTLVSLFVAAMAGVGSVWLLKGHPHCQGNPFRHSILPALTAWTIGIPLSNMVIGPQWWAVFGMGGIFLILVLIAEYISTDFNDVRHPLAAIGITALAFAFFLMLTISMRSAGMRLYLLLPALVVILLAVVMRSLYLRLDARWCWHWGFGITLIIAQLAIGFQYLPIRPLSYGLFLLGPAYALTSLAGSIEKNLAFRTAVVEPALILTITVLLGLLMG